jgi:hypothetical protein
LGGRGVNYGVPFLLLSITGCSVTFIMYSKYLIMYYKKVIMYYERQKRAPARKKIVLLISLYLWNYSSDFRILKSLTQLCKWTTQK